MPSRPTIASIAATKVRSTDGMVALAGRARRTRRRSRVLAGDQPHAPLKRDVRPRPLAHHRDPVPESDQPEDVEEQPEDPPEPAGDLPAVHVADRGPAADRREDAVVLVVKRLERLSRDRAKNIARRVR